MDEIRTAKEPKDADEEDQNRTSIAYDGQGREIRRMDANGKRDYRDD